MVDGWIDGRQADRHLLPRYVIQILLRNMHSAFRVSHYIHIITILV